MNIIEVINQVDTAQQKIDAHFEEIKQMADGQISAADIKLLDAIRNRIQNKFVRKVIRLGRLAEQTAKELNK